MWSTFDNVTAPVVINTQTNITNKNPLEKPFSSTSNIDLAKH